MKKLLLILFCAAFVLQTHGQKKLTIDKQQQILMKIDQSAQSLKTMQCSFKQTKNMKMLDHQMISEGMMYVKQPNKLRWEYNKPYDYTFILNAENVKIKSSKTTRNIQVEGNKLFTRITGLIMGCITGGGLTNMTDFSIEMFDTGSGLFARLYPRKKEIKQLYKYIDLHFNDALSMVSLVEMEEKNGDSTIILLQNTRTNLNLDENLFNVN